MSVADVSAPSRTATVPDVDLGIAVQAEDRGDLVESAGVDHFDRAAGQGLLGGLEDQPDAVPRP